MRTLFLTSYFAGTVNQFKTFVKSKNITSKEVLFISTASNVEEYTGYIDEGKAALINLGYKIEELDIAKKDLEEVRNKITKAKMIFIAGGNTFYLLQELKRKNLPSLIIERVDAGVPYIGESAGAMILAPSIEYGKVMDDANVASDLKDYNSLAITDFYTLPHYMEYPFTESVQKIMKDYQKLINLVPISNVEAILTDGSNFNIMK